MLWTGGQLSVGCSRCECPGLVVGHLMAALGANAVDWWSSDGSNRDECSRLVVGHLMAAVGVNAVD